ncbi:hypothetical protein ST47_g8117 [Ascochyta rabiei]|uniref:Uncharacterized protein n=1 Tax=Didymella rabiei TaxID=5454 RepID=A0A162ZPW7_DIDRA|nr:hypothetical protein ST47_g8117 [Ascochyta rabiei]
MVKQARAGGQEGISAEAEAEAEREAEAEAQAQAEAQAEADDHQQTAQDDGETAHLCRWRAGDQRWTVQSCVELSALPLAGQLQEIDGWRGSREAGGVTTEAKAAEAAKAGNVGNVQQTAQVPRPQGSSAADASLQHQGRRERHGVLFGRRVAGQGSGSTARQGPDAARFF